MQAADLAGHDSQTLFVTISKLGRLQHWTIEISSCPHLRYCHTDTSLKLSTFHMLSHRHKSQAVHISYAVTPTQVSSCPHFIRCHTDTSLKLSTFHKLSHRHKPQAVHISYAVTSTQASSCPHFIRCHNDTSLKLSTIKMLSHKSSVHTQRILA
jgi:hypothetical protein